MDENGIIWVIEHPLEMEVHFKWENPRTTLWIPLVI